MKLRNAAIGFIAIVGLSLGLTGCGDEVVDTTSSSSAPSTSEETPTNQFETLEGAVKASYTLLSQQNFEAFCAQSTPESRQLSGEYIYGGAEQCADAWAAKLNTVRAEDIYDFQDADWAIADTDLPDEKAARKLGIEVFPFADSAARDTSTYLANGASYEGYNRQFVIFDNGYEGIDLKFVWVDDQWFIDNDANDSL